MIDSSRLRGALDDDLAVDLPCGLAVDPHRPLDRPDLAAFEDGSVVGRIVQSHEPLAGEFDKPIPQDLDVGYGLALIHSDLPAGVGRIDEKERAGAIVEPQAMRPIEVLDDDPVQPQA